MKVSQAFSLLALFSQEYLVSEESLKPYSSMLSSYKIKIEAANGKDWCDAKPPHNGFSTKSLELNQAAAILYSYLEIEATILMGIRGAEETNSPQTGCWQDLTGLSLHQDWFPYFKHLSQEPPRVALSHPGNLFRRTLGHDITAFHWLPFRVIRAICGSTPVTSPQKSCPGWGCH